MKFTNPANTAGGQWIDKKELKNGDVIKLVTEAKEFEGQKGKQVVAKARLKGSDEEAKNVGINRQSMSALIEAFGEDSVNWMNQLLTLNVEKTVIAGKRSIILYLIPEGFEVTEDSGGYLQVTRKGFDKDIQLTPVENMDFGSEEAVNDSDVPF